MNRGNALMFTMLSIFFVTGMLGGCGSGKREGGEDQIAPATRVGSATCTSTCHATTTDITGNVIATTWANTTHTTVQGVQCEDCHGGGSLHWGVGPMPFPIPQAQQCAQARCHAAFEPGFDQTAHANTHAAGAPFGPDQFFFQGSASNEQATIIKRGGTTAVPEVTRAGAPVTKAQHIQECSVCHNPNQRFVYDPATGNLISPSQNASTQPISSQDGTSGVTTVAQNGFINPAVSCAGCHDAHQPQQMVKIPQRAAPVGYPIYRRYSTHELGRIVGTEFQPNGVAMGGTVSGRNNEINPELVCAACHTVSRYIYSNISTHQANVYPQWKNSGHGERNDPAWAEFSANPAAYVVPNTSANYTDTSHVTSYPIDMAIRTFGATVTTPASLTNNRGNNNFACFKCHNGLTSIAYQKNIQGTPAAPVVFGDASATCITCHDPHANGTFANRSTTRNNVRVPVVMTNYSTSSVKVFGNVFLDGKPTPSASQAENAIICIFCHQGRESGLTLYKTKLAPGKSSAGSFLNPHYLGTAAMLWGANGYEFTGKSYSANVAHQRANCTTCHMANATSANLNGGHTWNPNVATCNATSCHGGGVGPAVTAETGTNSANVDTYRSSFDTNDYDGNGTLEPVAVEIKNLQDKLIRLLADNGIFFSDVSYPYFFSNAAATTQFTAWNTLQGGSEAYKAAFNLQYVVKGLPSAGTSSTLTTNGAGLSVPITSQTLVPNASAAVHNYKYILQLLRDSYDAFNAVAGVKGPALTGVRPQGTRPATVYGPGQ